MIRHKLPPIEIHPILILFIIIAFVTGTFIELMIILSLVFFHEMGHFIVAKRFNWRVKKIKLWVFGGVMETDEHGTRPNHEELLVTLAGPFQHLIIFLILFLIPFEFIPTSILNIIYFYNTILFIFNLLPIWPLDGGKVLFILLTTITTYQKAYQLILLLSFSICLLFILSQLFITPFMLSSFLLFMFLLTENYTQWQQRFYVFFRFLLKRYEKGANRYSTMPIIASSEMKLTDVFSKFRTGKRHDIYFTLNGERLVLAEELCLQAYFKDKQYRMQLGEWHYIYK